MKIHTITCIEDNFTESEIKSTEDYVLNTLSPIKPLIERETTDNTGIVLYLRSDVVHFMPVGYSILVKSKISQVLRYA